jgi:type VI secretion system protein ImpL
MSWAIVTAIAVAVLLLAAVVVFLLLRRRKREQAGPQEPAPVPAEDPSWRERRHKPCILVTGWPGAEIETLLDPLTGADPGGKSGWRVVGEMLVYCAAAGTLMEEKSWDDVLRKLARRRPARPLDGLILALPASPDSETETAATILRERLDRLRERLGFVVPVYLVVTGGERIPGLATLRQSLAPEHSSQILGWSTDSRLDALLPDEWVETAFISIRETVARIQVKLLGARPAAGSSDELLALPAALDDLRRPLARFSATCGNARSCRRSGWRVRPLDTRAPGAGPRYGRKRWRPCSRSSY